MTLFLLFSMGYVLKQRIWETRLQWAYCGILFLSCCVHAFLIRKLCFLFLHKASMHSWRPGKRKLDSAFWLSPLGEFLHRLEAIVITANSTWDLRTKHVPSRNKRAGRPNWTLSFSHTIQWSLRTSFKTTVLLWRDQHFPLEQYSKWVH